MDLMKLPRAAIEAQLRLLRMPITVFEAVTRRDEGGSMADETRDNFVDEAVGRGKLLLGTLLRNDDLVSQGRLQQAKARERSEAQAAEAVAERREKQATEEFARRQGEAARRKVAVAREESVRKSEIERERAEAQRRVDEEARRRKSTVQAAEEARDDVADRIEDRARQERSQKLLKAAAEEKAAEKARDRADLLSDQRNSR